MNIEISFPGGKRVTARVGNHEIPTDQPLALGGEDAFPAPYDLFLASLGTCAGIYALGFLQARGLPADGLCLRQSIDLDSSTHLPTLVRFELKLPEGVPDKYRDAIVRAVENCRVKKTLAHPPRFEVVLAADATAAE